MSNFFERLKEERERLGLNQTDMGEVGGVRKETQSNYETGKRVPDADYLEKIAAAGVDVAYVVTGQRTPLATQEKPAAYGPGNGLDPRRQAIAAMLSDLDGDGLEHVQDAVEMAQQIKAMKEKIQTLEKQNAA